GRHYAARFCDVAFCVLDSHDFEKARAFATKYRNLAREEYGREIQVWTYCYVVEGETEKEAQDFYRYYVHEHGDWAAAENLVGTMIANAKTLPTEVLAQMKEHFIAGWGGFPLVGTREQITDKLQKLSDCGFDGVLLSWPRYQEGIRQFSSG